MCALYLLWDKVIMSKQICDMHTHIHRPSSPDPAVPVLSSNPTVLAIVEYCEQLGKLMTQLQQQELEVESERSQSPVPPHPRECVPPSIQDLIISWLGGINLVSCSLKEEALHVSSYSCYTTNFQLYSCYKLFLIGHHTCACRKSFNSWVTTRKSCWAKWFPCNSN